MIPNLKNCEGPNYVSDKTKKYKCQNQKCDKEFVKVSELYYHIDVVHKKNRHQCNHCNQHFPNSDLLNHHKIDVHENVKYNLKAKQYKCEKCDENFTTREYLKLHALNTHANKQITCVNRPKTKTFKSKNDLKIHIRY